MVHGDNHIHKDSQPIISDEKYWMVHEAYKLPIEAQDCQRA